MRQRLISWLFVLVIGMSSPQSAAASDFAFWRWWDSLSGPGPFSGIALQEVFICYGVDQRPIPPAQTPDWLLDLGCYHASRQRVRMALGFEWAWLAGRNNLPYAPPRGQSAPDVHAYPFMVTADFGIPRVPIVELGASVGLIRFSGEGFGFNRFAFGPRVTLKPLVLFSSEPKTQKKLEVLKLRWTGVGIPGSIDASDFGAIGSFASSGELIGGYMIIFDALPLLR